MAGTAAAPGGERGRRLRRALAALALLAVAWLAFVGWSVLDAYRHADRGRDLLREARRDVSVASVLDGTLLDRLEEAADELDAASDRLGTPLLGPARLLPVLGRNLTAGQEALRVGSDAVTVVAAAGTDVRAAIDDAGDDPAARVALLRTLATSATEVAEQLDAHPIDLRTDVARPLRVLRAELARDIAEVATSARRAGAATGALASLMDGPRTILLLAMNNAEMRAGAGMPLAMTEVRTSGGELDVAPFVLPEELTVPAAAVPLPPELDALWGWASPGTEFRNLMLSPRFPTSAAMAAQMWAATGAPLPDTVLGIDPVALAAIVDVLGSIEVAGERYGPEELLDELLRGQYEQFGRDERPERQERSAEIASAVLDALFDRDWSVVDMADALRDVAAGRHLLLWSADAATELAWEAAGVAGDVEERSLLVALNSRVPGKLDPFIEIEATLEVTPGADGTDLALHLRIENDTPADVSTTVSHDQPDIGIEAGEYRAILAVTIPGSASGASFDGVPALNVAGTDGPTSVLGYLFDLPRGGTHEATLRFRLPPSLEELRVESSGRVPPIQWRCGDREWQDGTARSVAIGREPC